MTAGAGQTASNLPPLRARGGVGVGHCSAHREENVREEADRDFGVRRAKGDGQGDGSGVYSELNGVYSELRGVRGVRRRFALFRQVL
jgi:hypothetical protein